MKTDFCVACNEVEDLNHHHLVPRSQGGTDNEENLITLCRICHGKVHDALFKPHVKLVKDGIEKAKREGKSLGPNTPRVTLETIMSNKEKLDIKTLPAMILYSYGYYLEDVAKLRWIDVSSLPLREDYKDFLLSVRDGTKLDEHYLSYYWKTKTKPSSGNSISVNVFRQIKELGDIPLETPPISTQDLIDIYKFMEDSGKYDQWAIDRAHKKTKVLKKKLKQEKLILRPQNTETIVPAGFPFSQSKSEIKYEEWSQLKGQIEYRILFCIFLKTWGVNSADIANLTFKDLFSCEDLPEVLKEELHDLFKEVKSQKLDTYVAAQSYHTNKKNKGSSIDINYLRYRNKYFPDRPVRKMHSKSFRKYLQTP